MPKIKQTDKSAIVGQQLREARQAQNITQEVLSKKLGITFQQLQKYERGIDSISIDKLFAICTLLNLSASNIIKNVEQNIKTVLPVSHSIKRHFKILFREANKINDIIKEKHGDQPS